MFGILLRREILDFSLNSAAGTGCDVEESEIRVLLSGVTRQRRKSVVGVKKSGFKKHSNKLSVIEWTIKMVTSKVPTAFFYLHWIRGKQSCHPLLANFCLLLVPNSGNRHTTKLFIPSLSQRNLEPQRTL